MRNRNKTAKDSRNWPKDEFGRQEVAVQWFWIIGVPLIFLLAAGLAALVLPGLAWLKGRTPERVIVYCAQDQTYAEPILRQFEAETGLEVRAVYDSEAVKTVGLANRLLAERDHPRCDVFWGNEEMRTRQLAALGVWRETNGVVSFGARSRCLVINTNRLPPLSPPAPGTGWDTSRPGVPPVPGSLLDLTNSHWKGRVAVAFPQFGTTATHFHVLRQDWGDAVWRAWCRGLVANETQVLDGNSTVVRRVGRGEAWIGLTDTDDVLAGQREGLPVARGPVLPETLLFIPNTVGIVRNAPHPGNAQQLADYLRRPDVVTRLREAGAIQYLEVPGRDQAVLRPDWDRLLADLDSTVETINGIFLK